MLKPENHHLTTLNNKARFTNKCKNWSVKIRNDIPKEPEVSLHNMLINYRREIATLQWTNLAVTVP